MAVKWHSIKNFGVRYYEHEARRHGPRKDQYFAIRYQLDGKRVEEGIGWASKGWTVKKAAGILAELQENQRRGEGPRTLREKRALEAAERKAKEQQAEQAEKDSLTFDKVFTDQYLPHIKANRRNARSCKYEESYYKKWIKPVIGGKPLKDVAPFHLEKIKKDLSEAKRAPRTIELVLAIVRQVFNYAINNALFEGINPAGPSGKVKRPKFDNRRKAYLTKKQWNALSVELAKKSTEVRDLALLSINTGMRANEIFSLTWGDVDLEGGQIFIKDTKSAENRHAFINEAVKTMLQSREEGEPADLVFPARGGKGKIKQISNTFNRAVDELKINEGITDRRQRITFHSLRHTFASWLVDNDVNIYHVQALLGHKDLKLTERYSHVRAESLRAAVASLEPNKVEPGGEEQQGSDGQQAVNSELIFSRG